MHETSVISSLVELTQQRDQLSIRAKLIAALMDATDSTWVVRCRFSSSAGIDVLDRIASQTADKSLPHFPDDLFDRVDRFQACARDNQPTRIAGTTAYQGLILPMNEIEQADEFVVLLGGGLNDRDERTAVSILSLYNNFLSLLIESTRDALTGLYNRGVFDHDLASWGAQINSQNKRSGDAPGDSAYLAMLDVDHFKRINDQFGHLYGDEVLLLFAKILRDTFRRCEKIYRYGGEEFAIIVNPTNDKDVSKLMERLREAVADFEFPRVGHVTVSVGIAPITGYELPSDIVDRADHALYQSKQNGRNRVTLYDPTSHSTEKHDSDIELF